jgi:hypothetical protein
VPIVLTMTGFGLGDLYSDLCCLPVLGTGPARSRGEGLSTGSVHSAMQIHTPPPPPPPP